LLTDWILLSPGTVPSNLRPGPQAVLVAEWIRYAHLVELLRLDKRLRHDAAGGSQPCRCGSFDQRCDLVGWNPLGHGFQVVW
jgi:hypothetical protein